MFENGTIKTFAPASPYISQRLYGTYPLDYRWGHYYGPHGRISRGEVADYIGYSLYGSEYMKASNQYNWGAYLTGAGVAVGYIASAACLGAGMPYWTNYWE